MSNDRDGVSDDGQEPVGAASSGEAADLSATDAPAGVPSDDGRERARTAPAADGVSGGTESGGTESGGAIPPAGSGPVAAGSARAAARRSAARAGVSDTKGAATPKRAAATTVKRPNMFARFSRFLREVVAELRKVIWPTKNQMVTYTIVVIAFVAFMVALVGVLDLLFAKGVLAVFG